MVLSILPRLFPPPGVSPGIMKKKPVSSGSEAPASPACDAESTDAVWMVLGRARAIRVDPSFSQRVIMTVRAEREAPAARWAWVHRFAVQPVKRRPLAWTAATASTAAAAAALVLLMGDRQLLRGLSTAPPIPRPAASQLAIAPAPAASVEAGEIMETLIAELALLDEAERLLEPEDALTLEESDVRQLLF